jgi:hypothetical protein
MSGRVLWVLKLFYNRGFILLSATVGTIKEFSSLLMHGADMKTDSTKIFL